MFNVITMASTYFFILLFSSIPLTILFFGLLGLCFYSLIKGNFPLFLVYFMCFINISFGGTLLVLMDFDFSNFALQVIDERPMIVILPLLGLIASLVFYFYKKNRAPKSIQNS